MDATGAGRAGEADEASGDDGDPVSGRYPADLLEAYRVWVRTRQEDWQDSHAQVWRALAAAADAIRVHPYWWTLPDANAVARAAKQLRSLALLPVAGERARVRPYPSAAESESRSWLEQRRREGPYPELAAALDAAGHWSRLPEGERTAAKADVESFGILGDARYERMFFADGEDLAEQGVAELFTEMGPGLLAVGLPLRVNAVSDPFDRNGPWEVDYVLDINGLCCEIWTEDQAKDASCSLWYLATIRPLMALTRLLEQAGIPERLFTDAAGGNEGVVHLIRPEVNSLMFDGKGLDPVLPL
jgi:hypothetical protein